MTQAQQQAVIDAQTKFFAADAAFEEANSLAIQADAAYTNSQATYRQTLNDNSAKLAAAGAAVQTAQQARTDAFTKSQAAQAAASQAQLDYDAAIAASRQTGAVEIPGNAGGPFKT